MVLNFPGYGIWTRVNNASWVQLHVLNSTTFATGNMDGLQGDEVIVDFGPLLWCVGPLQQRELVQS